jgi:hypothetical protein
MTPQEAVTPQPDPELVGGPRPIALSGVCRPAAGPPK